MAEHWYWVAECATDTCGGLQVLKHIGPQSVWHDGLTHTLHVAFPASPLRLKCPLCQQDGSYAMQDVYPLLLPEAPPGFADKF